MIKNTSGRHRPSLRTVGFNPVFGKSLSSCLHRYRYKAIQRYRAAHEDIMSAISKKDKALQKMLKHTDAATLMEISEEAVTSSGIGIYRQKKRVAEGSVSTAGPSPNQPAERLDQLRQKFAQSLKVRAVSASAVSRLIVLCLSSDNMYVMRGWRDSSAFGPGVHIQYGPSAQLWG